MSERQVISSFDELEKELTATFKKWVPGTYKDSVRLIDYLEEVLEQERENLGDAMSRRRE